MAKSTESDAKGYVYLISLKGIQRFKIGFSKHPKSRLNSIETSSPAPVLVHGMIRGTRDTERALHRYLRSFRVHREWFDFPESVAWGVLKLFGAKGIPDGH